MPRKKQYLSFAARKARARSSHMAGSTYALIRGISGSDLTEKEKERLFAVQLHHMLEDWRDTDGEVQREFEGLPQEEREFAQELYRSIARPLAAKDSEKAAANAGALAQKLRQRLAGGPEAQGPAAGGPGPAEGPAADHPDPARDYQAAAQAAGISEEDYRSAGAAWAWRRGTAPGGRSSPGAPIHGTVHSPPRDGGERPGSVQLPGDAHGGARETVVAVHPGGEGRPAGAGRERDPGLPARPAGVRGPTPVRGPADPVGVRGDAGPPQPGADPMVRVMRPDGTQVLVDRRSLFPPELPWDGTPSVYSDARDTDLTEEQAWDVLEQDTTPCVTEITVDRDHVRAKELPSLEVAELADQVGGRLYERTSSDGQGHHYQLVLPRPCTAWQALQARVRLGDDPARVRYDLYRAALGRREDASGWLADAKCYWPKGAGEFGETWTEAGPWREVAASSTRGT